MTNKFKILTCLVHHDNDVLSSKMKTTVMNFEP